MEAGKQPPNAYYDQPEIVEEMQAYWTAFIELGTERQLGMGLGPIPRSQVLRYASEELGLAGEGMYFFVDVIRRVDDGYLSIVNKETSKKLSDKDKVANEVPMSDPAGIKNLLLRAGAGARKRKPKK